MEGKERVDGRYRDGGIPPEEQRCSDREMVVLVMTGRGGQTTGRAAR